MALRGLDQADVPQEAHCSAHHYRIDARAVGEVLGGERFAVLGHMQESMEHGREAFHVTSYIT
jgi:hypothetical protein